jgi:hypothetical protein
MQIEHCIWLGGCTIFEATFDFFAELIQRFCPKASTTSSVFAMAGGG